MKELEVPESPMEMVYAILFCGGLCALAYWFYSDGGSYWAMGGMIVSGFFCVVGIGEFCSRVKKRGRYLSEQEQYEEIGKAMLRKGVKSPKPAGKTIAGEYYDPDTGEILELAPKKKAKASKPKTSAKKDSFSSWEERLSTVWHGKEEIEFVYEKRDGEVSRRRVTLYAVKSDGGDRVYLYGLCHMRNEERTFNLDNIPGEIKLNGVMYDFGEFFDKLGLDIDELW
jgi:hypothetical protein